MTSPMGEEFLASMSCVGGSTVVWLIPITTSRSSPQNVVQHRGYKKVTCCKTLLFNRGIRALTERVVPFFMGICVLTLPMVVVFAP